MSETNHGPSEEADSDVTRSISAAGNSDDPRLFAAVQEYMAELDAGRRPHRREFLARYPQIAAELAACLDGLALVHSAAENVLPPADLSPDPALAAGQPLGDFRLVREIGRGGMGVVYEAMQLSLGRRVALKVLPFAAALDSRQLERFRNEAQAAAQLHHTNIVPVYAVGCERSVHFYAMQLIEGQSLAEVIRHLRQVAHPQEGATPSLGGRSEQTMLDGSAALQTPDSGTLHTASEEPVGTVHLAASTLSSAANLSTLRSSKGSAYARSVANLGLQVAEALDYAHRGGIVHRDIKPANLLLDARGTLWVTDFGLAQFFTQTDLTRTGDLVGTLRYMSPEQASGRAVVLDQRTDIYSLGVTLFELLTLERALQGQTHEQLLYELANEEPRSARAVDKTIPREIDVILCKAMAKEPADRYPTARAMADDLARFLRDEPILARPPTLWDKAWKWTRRHRAWALAGVVVLTLSTAALLVSTVAIAREQANTRRAYQAERVEAIEARQQRTRAERSWAEAREAVDFFSSVAISMDRPEFSEVRRDLLEESQAYYQQFIDERRDDPSVGPEIAAAQARVSSFLELYAALDAWVRAESRLALLRETSVRKDLQLTPDQDTAAQTLANSLGGGPRGDFKGSDDRKRIFSARAQEIDASLTLTLGAQGAERLRQISRQVRGPAAFSDPDVVDHLALTREQRTKIRNIQVLTRNSPGHGGGPGGHGPDGQLPPGDDSGDLPGEEKITSIAPILALLSPSQAAVWASMTGAPFTGHVSKHGFGGDRGGGPPSDDNRRGPANHGPGGVE